jgi:hypothetical protein
MSKHIRTSPGYPLPEDLTTDEFISVCIRIPNLPEYRKAFWGNHWQLARWQNWERDARKGGSIAAQFWRQIIYEDETKYLAGEGCGEVGNPCCPDLIDAVNRLYTLQLSQADTGTAQSFAPDAPTNYNGASGQSPTELARRNAALCAAIIGYIVGILQQAVTAAVGSAATQAIALMVAAFTGQYYLIPSVLAVGTTVSAVALVVAIANTNAIRRVACAMYEGLKGKTTNQSNFAGALAGTAFDGDEAVIATVVGAANNLPDNYRGFTMRLGANYNLSNGSDDSACICCDDNAPILKVTTGTITKTGAFSYRLNSARELNGNDKVEVQIVGEVGSCGMCIKTVTLEPNKSYGTPGVTYFAGNSTSELAATGMCLFSFKVHVLNGYGQDGPFYVDFTICDTSCEGYLDCVDCE